MLTFPKSARLSGDKLFGLVLAEGGRKAFTGGEIFWRENALPYARFGFRVSSKVGKAHIRITLRRRLRETVRKNQSLFKPGCDYLIIIRHPNLFPQMPEEKMPAYLFSLFGPEVLQRVS
ncbi:MAG: ribonuclease P protein component [candidate division Zixibacteria bacterium]|nr:ribonuclease P protein component [candidate division Zixibacteria bacterium]MCI0595945.1 ribonuclease P protein component [candidate division Zixibacteria bacterium]